MARVYPGDRVRAAKSHPFYEEIKNDEMIVIAVELTNDMSEVRVQTATGTSKGFSSLPWENWKTGWREHDLEIISAAPVPVSVTPVVAASATPTAKTAAKAAEQAANKVVNA